MLRIDNFIFQYLLSIDNLYWSFRNLPRDVQLEQEFIKLGRKEAVAESNPNFDSRAFVWSQNTIWKELGIPQLPNGLIKFKIVDQAVSAQEKKENLNLNMQMNRIPDSLNARNTKEQLYCFSKDGFSYQTGLLYASSTIFDITHTSFTQEISGS